MQILTKGKSGTVVACDALIAGGAVIAGGALVGAGALEIPTFLFLFLFLPIIIY